MDPSQSYLKFIRMYAQKLVAEHTLPRDKEEWIRNHKVIRKNLLKAVGGFPEKRCDLDPVVVEKLDFEDYHIEKILIQTLPDVWMTGNVYVPNGLGPYPAMLCVHGHWQGAKQDPVVQARCCGLVKQGFVVLAVDAFGAGERGISTSLGEYHGEMTAATLLPTGQLLAGIQMYENSRCADYLQSRTDVDGERLGITGTSGGGNQTMYAGAIEERFGVVIPVCSVGNYQAYLGTACCMCELIPGVLTFTEEWGVLGLIAPRALMIINATQDAVQFSVEEAKKSVAKAKTIFCYYGVERNIRHVPIESQHDYNKPMREAMYGWVCKHLKKEGDGSPIDEPNIETVAPEILRCFADDSRPKSYVTIPKLARRFSRQALKHHIIPNHKKSWEEERDSRLDVLKEIVGIDDEFVTEPVPIPIPVDPSQQNGGVRFELESEPGIRCLLEWDEGLNQEIALTVGFESEVFNTEEAAYCQKYGVDRLNLTLRATGCYSPKPNRIGNAIDHNTGQWGAWVGRPLVGQWVKDIQIALAWIEESYNTYPQVTLVTRENAFIPGAIAAALENRIHRVVGLDCPLTLQANDRYGIGSLGVLFPDMLQMVGDINHLCALISPRPLCLVAGKNMQGEQLTDTILDKTLKYVSAIYELNNSEGLSIISAENKKKWPQQIFGT